MLAYNVVKCQYKKCYAVLYRSTMKQLGLKLSENDIHAMMRSVGVGPLGKICFNGLLVSLLSRDKMWS